MHLGSPNHITFAVVLGPEKKKKKRILKIQKIQKKLPYLVWDKNLLINNNRDYIKWLLLYFDS